MPKRRTKRGSDRTPLDGDCEVLICGASFAGLAVGRELAQSGARTLIVDRYELGERQTSACAAPTEWLRAMGVETSIKQTFEDLVIHTPYVTTRMRLPWTFSTFDYPSLCELLFDQCDARFETAKVDGRTGTTVHTDRGDLQAPLVDRLPRLAARPRPSRVPANGRATLARVGGAPRRGIKRPGDLDRSRLCAGRLQLELPRRGRGPDRGGFVRPPRGGQGLHDSPRPGPRPRSRPVPGQLDPPQAAQSGGGRGFLRRRLGGTLPAVDRRGNPDRVLLRNRLRAGAARGGRRGTDTRTRPSVATAPSPPHIDGSSNRCCVCSA